MGDQAAKLRKLVENKTDYEGLAEEAELVPAENISETEKGSEQEDTAAKDSIEITFDRQEEDSESELPENEEESDPEEEETGDEEEDFPDEDEEEILKREQDLDQREKELEEKQKDLEQKEKDLEEKEKRKYVGSFWEEKQNTRVIAITSGKGGVGKTNLTVNLAIALGQAGQRVLVIDADIGMANVDVVLGNMSRKHLLNLLEDGVTLQDVLIQGPYGVNYISGGSSIEKAQECGYEERESMMRKLAGCASLADIILVDTGAGLGKTVMDFILAADEVLLVTTPEPTALTDAYAVMKAYSMHSERKDLNVVVNRVYNERESRDVTEKLAQTARKFLKLPVKCIGYIFDDRAVVTCVRKQVPFLAAEPNTDASKCVKALADSLLYGKEQKVRQGWKGFLKQIFKF